MRGLPRTLWIGLSFAMLVAANQRPLHAQSGAAKPDERLLGIYVFAGERLTVDAAEKLPPQFLPFIKYCGYNTLEFCDYSFEYPESARAEYFSAFQTRIAEGHQAGLKVFVLLMTNMSRDWTRLSSEPTDDLTKFLFNPAAKPAEFKQRIEDVQTAVEKGFPRADGFEVFAGDWGGCMGEGCDREQYLSFARAYAQAVRKSSPQAEVTLNTWAIANWGTSFDVGKPSFWDAEIDLSQKIIGGDISFADAVTLPGHHLYRFLVRRLYVEAKRPVPEWPDRAAIDSIHAKGKRAYLWPHFIVGDDRSRKMTWRKVHSEVRYLKELAEKIQRLGIDGEFVNAYNPAFDMGNIYAYGQLHRNPSKPVRVVLREFAALIARPDSVESLTEVFTFLENQSWWGEQMPTQFRLKPLPCKLRSYEEATAALRKVEPLSESPAPLLMAPKDFLAEIGSTLVFMKEQHAN